MAARKRPVVWLLKPLLILVLCVACSLILVRSTLIAKARTLRISPETTVLLEVDPNGKLPYLQTYLGHLTDVVPEDDDAGVVLARLGSADSISWDDFWDYVSNQQANLWKETQKVYFISPSRLIRILEDEGGLEPFHFDSTLTEKQLDEQLAAATASPWNPDDDPVLAEWLQRNDAVLRLGKTVCLCSRHTVSPPRPDERILSWWDPNVERYEEISQLLACRAQSRIAAGQWDLALSDALACRDLARLAGQCPGTIHYMKARRIELRSMRLLSALATTTAGESARLAELQRHTVQPRVLPSLAEVIDQQERLVFLEMCFMLSRFPASKENELLIEESQSVREAARAGTDWNIVMETWNRQIDELVSILNEPDFPMQTALLKGLTDRLTDKAQGARVSIIRTILHVAPESETSAARLCRLFIPGLVLPAQGEQERSAIQTETAILISIHQFKADYGRWPESLSQLVPKYLSEIPRNPNTQQSPEYHANGGTFTLETVVTSSTEE